MGLDTYQHRLNQWYVEICSIFILFGKPQEHIDCDSLECGDKFNIAKQEILTTC